MNPYESPVQSESLDPALRLTVTKTLCFSMLFFGSIACVVWSFQSGLADIGMAYTFGMIAGLLTFVIAQLP